MEVVPRFFNQNLCGSIGGGGGGGLGEGVSPVRLFVSSTAYTGATTAYIVFHGGDQGLNPVWGNEV